MTKQRNILIVDDNSELRELVRLTLEYSDYALHEAENADEALLMIKEIHPEVILLDIMMPGEMDGLELCRLIKSHPKMKAIRVILLTAKGQQPDLKLGGEAGADAYFVKPFSPMSLLDSINGNNSVDWAQDSFR